MSALRRRQERSFAVSNPEHSVRQLTLDFAPFRMTSLAHWLSRGVCLAATSS